MPDTNMDAGEADLIAQFEKGFDADGAKAMAERLLAAEGKLVDALKAQADDQAATIAAITERAERAEAEAQALKDAAARQAAEATVIAEDSVGAPRKLALVPADKRLAPSELAAAIADSETVEILFSDGKREIQSLGSRKVTGEAWIGRPAGLLLTKPVELFGGAAGAAPIVVSGYALLLDGKLAAYSARDPLSIPAGGHVRLENDIIF